jgi:hypothetical protein
MWDNKWARLLAYVTGLVNQRLLLQCEYLIVENRILRSRVSGSLRLSDPERCTLAEIGKRLGPKHLKEGACVAKPETILAWYRRLIARKFDGSKRRSYPGRVDSAIEDSSCRWHKRTPLGAMIALLARWPISAQRL